MPNYLQRICSLSDFIINRYKSKDLKEYYLIRFKKYIHLLDVKSPPGHKEFSKQFLIYPSLKKKIFIKAFPLLSPLFKKVNLHAPEIDYIFMHDKIRFFNFNRKEVITSFNKITKRSLLQLVSIRETIPSPSVIDYNIRSKVIIEEYIDLQFPSLKYYLERTKKLLKLYKTITSTRPEKKVKLKYFFRALVKRKHKLVINKTLFSFLYNKYKIYKYRDTCFNLVYSHNDFHKGNVPIHKGKLYVIDFDTVDYNLKYYDLIHFLFVPLTFSRRYVPLIKKVYDNFLNLIEENYLLPILVELLSVRDDTYLTKLVITDFLQKQN